MAEIRPLKDFPQFAPVLAYWSYNLWYRNRDIEFDIVVRAYRQRAQMSTLPCAWVAIEETMPIGMVSLKENDLWSRKDLNPWLASLHVAPEFQKRGSAKQLINAVIEKSKEFSFNKIYLFLGRDEGIDLAGYYSRMGWRFLEDAVDNDEMPTKIYYYCIS